MAATKGGSWDRLLNAAEQVFAEKGCDAATTRQIAALSGDTLGTLSYHFKTKDVLLREVLTRRFEEMNELRRAMYAEFSDRRGGGVPDLDEAITAIVKLSSSAIDSLD
jgi:AcrR family transcriptional regulator